MKTVLIIHGIQGHAGIHWQQWLHDELVKKGYKVIMPTLPKADLPDRVECLGEVVKLTRNIDLKELTIVGHSLGVATALDFIEQAKSKVKKLVSVSGFSEDYGAELNSYFMAEKTIDFEKVRKCLDGADVVYGDDDPYVPQNNLNNLAKELGVKPVVIKKGGHLNTRSGYTKFPLLLKLV